MLTQACTNRVILICNAEAHAIFNQITTSERMMPEENAPITGECKLITSEPLNHLVRKFIQSLDRYKRCQPYELIGL